LTASVADTRAYYQAARASLSPLIVHLRDIPDTLASLASDNGQGSKAVATAAQSWANDCATARDLVGRLTPLPGPVGAQVARLYQTAAMLQGEAARTAAAAAGAPATQRVADAEEGRQLYSLGDRLFDSAYRLLNSRGAMSQMEMRFPPALPDYGKAQDGTTSRALDGVARWLTAHDGQVAQEAVTDLRLAAAVWSRTSTDPDRNARVRLMGDRVWSGALDLLAAAGARVDPYELPTARPEQALFTGGAFNGHPPALPPGDPPGKDVPGGLPALDSPMLLGH
jgi:hypothetical protein